MSKAAELKRRLYNQGKKRKILLRLEELSAAPIASAVRNNLPYNSDTVSSLVKEVN